MSGSSEYETDSDADYPVGNTSTQLPLQNKTSPVIQEQQQQVPLAKEAPTQRPFNTAIFAAEVSFTLRELFDLKGRLLHGGKIELSVAEGTLKRIWCSHESDFKASDLALSARLSTDSPVPTTTPLAGHHHLMHDKKKKKKKHDRNTDDFMMQQHQFSDIVKALEIKHLTATWKKAVSIEFPSVSKYKNEGHMGKYVGVYFIPNKLSASRGLNFKVCDRVITNQNIKFRESYPRSTLASLEKDMEIVKGKAYINFSSPFFSVYNAPKWGNTPYLGPTPAFAEQNQVRMEEADAIKWLAIAKTEIASHMSYGDVTGNFKVSIFVPIPPYRERDHRLFLEGKPGGYEFKSFADKEYNFRGQDLSQIDDSYLDNRYEFNFEVHAAYLPAEK